MDATVAGFQKRVFDWSNRVFPDRTWKETFDKLSMEEIPEIFRDPDDPSEYADAFILLVDLASQQGIDLFEAASAKMKVLEQSDWQKCPKTGVMRRIKT